jgi:hypothetical protein
VSNAFEILLKQIFILHTKKHTKKHTRKHVKGVQKACKKRAKGMQGDRQRSPHVPKTEWWVFFCVQKTQKMQRGTDVELH